MGVALLPRLKALGVETALARSLEAGISSSNTLSVLSDYSDMLSYAASGGSKAGTCAINMGKELKAIAVTVGFPKETSQAARAQFDQEAAIYLGQVIELRSGEALRNDVWAFLTTVIVPDIVCWRFSKKSHERFAGGARNTLQRLWARGVGLDRGPEHPDRWGLIRTLTEDSMVQIFERPSISSSRELTMALAEGWQNASAKSKKNNMEDIMRTAVKMIRLRSQIIDLAYLEQDELKGIVNDIFERSMAGQDRKSSDFSVSAQI
jgi:hypothetical protein